MPLRVLQIVDTLGMGGAETWLMEVLRLWAKSRVAQIDFVATSGNPGVFDEEARQLGANIHHVRYGRTSLPQFAARFRRILRTGRYAAIHDHQDYASGWHFFLGQGVLPPVRVTHVHNPAYQIRSNYGITPGRRLAARIGKRLIARHATHITGTSRQVVSEYGFDARQFGDIPKTALHCGFQLARFRGDPAAAKAKLCGSLNWPPDARIILVAGRIDRSPDADHPQTHKNSGFAVSVGIECARRDGRVHVLFAGALSPAVPVLQQRIAAAGLAGRFRFAGIRTDIDQLMVASDALLFPSRGEGLGMVAVEAQAAGLPVLAATTVPRECVVVPELVRFLDLEAGAAEWAAVLLECAAQPRNIAEANRRVAASTFAIDNSAGALFKLYSEGVIS
jgi:glycosyltransferase involved in cell wall biosynthesis